MTPEQLQAYLKQQVIISNQEEMVNFLKFTSPSRLDFLTRPFRETDTGNFKPNITFDSIFVLHNFERHLRSSIEKTLRFIEESIRSLISNVMSEKHGSHWFMDDSLFKKDKQSQEHLIEIRKKIMDAVYQNQRVIDYYPIPPSCIVVERTSFSLWSKLYSNLTTQEQKYKICQVGFGHKQVGFGHRFLESWLRFLASLRNELAHCSPNLIWDRHKLKANQPKIPTKKYPQLKNVERNSLYIRLFIIQILLNEIKILPDWKQELQKLINHNQFYEKIPFNLKGMMGFPEDWEKDPFWNFQDESQ